jgi:tetratricopeptide (TPR) repeat protein
LQDHSLLAPGSFDPCLAAAHQALLDGSPDQALAAAAAALRKNRADLAALVLSADAFTACGKPLEALQLLQRVVALQPDNPALYLLPAHQLVNLGRPEEAQLSLERGLARLEVERVGSQIVDSPGQLQLLFKERLAQVLSMQGQLEHAWLELASLLPQSLSLCSLAADLLLKLNRPDEALPLAQRYAETACTADAFELQARCQFRLGDQSAYAALHRKASRRFPQDAGMASLAAQATFDEDDSEATVALGWDVLRTGLQCAGPTPELRFVESRQLLLDGHFEQGWSAYESRLQLPNNQLRAPCPESWDAQDPAGRSVVVVAEQGVGDVLFFSRFLPALIAEAGPVYVLVEPRLVSLLRRSFPQVVVLEQLELARALAGQQALWIPLGSLPLRYGASAQAIARSHSVHLTLQRSLQTLWAQRLDHETVLPLRIGLSLTAGGVQQEYQQKKRDVQASMVLEPLKNRSVTLIDLQHRSALSNVSQEALQILRFEGITRDLDQLCALVSQLDGLITCDQTNAFLGGLLGIPTLVLVPPNPHFMFGRQGRRSLWFDSVHVVRAPRWGDWQGASADYKRALGELFSGT